MATRLRKIRRQMVISNRDSSRTNLATDLGVAEVATMAPMQMLVLVLVRALLQLLKQAALRQLLLRTQSQQHRQVRLTRRLASLLRLFKRALK